MMDRREFGIAALGASMGASLVLGTRPAIAAANRVEPLVGDDGMFYQSWFLNSFNVLGDDLAEAADNGKRFVVMWEQRGCPYCRETHQVNFARPEINRFIRENFDILQLNLWGSREVTDFDGEAMEERALARKWGIMFTPTIMFFPDTLEAAAGRSGRDIEVVRMPGYFKPFHFISMFEYVREKANETTHFQKYIQAKGDRLRAKGEAVQIW